MKTAYTHTNGGRQKSVSASLGCGLGCAAVKRNNVVVCLVAKEGVAVSVPRDLGGRDSGRQEFTKTERQSPQRLNVKLIYSFYRFF